MNKLFLNTKNDYELLQLYIKTSAICFLKLILPSEHVALNCSMGTAQCI